MTIFSLIMSSESLRMMIFVKITARDSLLSLLSVTRCLIEIFIFLLKVKLQASVTAVID